MSLMTTTLDQKESDEETNWYMSIDWLITWLIDSFIFAAAKTWGTSRKAVVECWDVEGTFDREGY